MKSFLKYLDYYSLNVNLSYKGKEKYSTLIGGCLTLFCITFVMLNAWLIGNDIFKKENPSIIGSDEDLGYNYPNYTINYENFFIGYSVSDAENNPFHDETILKVVPIHYTNNYDSNGTLTYKKTELSKTSCSDYFLDVNLTFPLSPSIMKPLNCIKDLNHSIGGFWTVDYMNYIYLEVYTCNNKTIKIGDKPCKSKEIIGTTLSKLYFNIFYQSVLVNSKNHSHPMKTIILEDWHVMQPNLYKGFEYYFENYMVYTDDGIIFNSELKKSEKLGFQKLKQDYKIIEDEENNGLILMFDFYISNQNKIYLRTYIKLQNIFANLGGIIQVIIIVTRFFYIFYVKKKFNIKIMNKLFDFVQDEELTSKISEGVRKQNIRKLTRRSGLNNFYNPNINNSFIYFGPTDKGIKLKPQFSSTKILKINKDQSIKTQYKKFKLMPFEYFSSIFCSRCLHSRNLKNKNNLYLKLLKDVNSCRDIMRIMKTSQNFTKLKYLLLSSEQLLTFKYLEKPKKTNKGESVHEFKSFAEAFEQQENQDEKNVEKIVKYFNRIQRENKFSHLDLKLLSIIDERILNKIDYNSNLENSSFLNIQS